MNTTNLTLALNTILTKDTAGGLPQEFQTWARDRIGNSDLGDQATAERVWTLLGQRSAQLSFAQPNPQTYMQTHALLFYATWAVEAYRFAIDGDSISADGSARRLQEWLKWL